MFVQKKSHNGKACLTLAAARRQLVWWRLAFRALGGIMRLS